MNIYQILFEESLEEARRNPEKNPKISSADALRAYKDNPDIYISFTDINKIGINPKSDYDSPNGIYTYPLREMFKNIQQDSIPYAGGRPYIYILERTSKNFVEDLYKDYTNKDYTRDEREIKNLLYASKEFTDWAEMMEMSLEDTFTVIREQAFKKARIKGPSGFFWSLSREASNMFDFSTIQVRTLQKGSSTQSWNNLLRKLGYEGFADKSGKGIIHIAEPTQAVFLTSKAFKVIDKIHNYIKTEV